MSMVVPSSDWLGLSYIFVITQCALVLSISSALVEPSARLQLSDHFDPFVRTLNCIGVRVITLPWILVDLYVRLLIKLVNQFTGVHIRI